MGVTRDLCEAIAGERFEDLAPEAVAAARQAILDGVAVGIARPQVILGGIFLALPRPQVFEVGNRLFARALLVHHFVDHGDRELGEYRQAGIDDLELAASELSKLDRKERNGNPVVL